ncbi:uncharacterized protein CCR75_005087 [Bremia lactucae]|uniref:START domain-containing protein n=1 Tax=Bremia lactucae TaxID=4779 RepID=A0A976IM60_BRELC|nr:hypothetical protein CCR75_005087 [Bremia lactucae]
MVSSDVIKKEVMMSGRSEKVKSNSFVPKRFASPFSPLHLSSTTTMDLEVLEHRLVARNIGAYESFLEEHHGIVDEDQWKLVSSKDELKAYAEHQRASDAPRVYQHETPAVHVPIILITGTIKGNLDDLMYGLACTTTEQGRINFSYVNDDVPRSCVLATLTPPSDDNPFTSFCIKWVELVVPLAIRPIVKHRDFVYMETMGFERLRNGERVGYHIVHSVQFPETPVLDTHFRGNCSISMFYHQRASNRIDVYVKGFFNPAGGIMRAIVIKLAARTLLCVAKHVYCGQMKKLAWALKRRQSGDLSSSDSESTGRSSNDSADDRHCCGCRKKQSVLVQAVLKTNPGTKLLQKKRHCKICTRYLCLECRRQHQLSFMLPDQRLSQILVTICESCEIDALSVAAGTISQEEMLYYKTIA